MASSDPQFERRLAAIFQAEAAEHVQRMQACLAEAAGAGEPGLTGKPLEQLFRATHSLKGAARAVGEDEVEIVCHATESLLAALQRGQLAWSPAIVDALHDVADALQGALSRRAGAAGTLAALVPRLERLEGASRPDATGSTAPGAAPAVLALPADAAVPPAGAAPALPPAAFDGAETVRIPVERLAKLLHQVEELVAARIQSGLQVGEVEDILASLGAQRAAAAGQRAPAGALQQVESRLRGLKSLAVRDQRQLAGAVDTLLADVKKTLLLPVGSLRPFLLATVRELARSQGKEVELRLGGDEVEMDRRLLDELREPLVHLLRNAIAHGLEPPQQRVAAGKPARGLLEVAIAARSGGRVEITVADDGAGIDTERLVEAARELQLPIAEEADRAELLQLAFGRGVSTAAHLTEVAGRGIGLPIVRDTVERMGGTITVASERGRGTSFTIQLTSSLATYRAIEVRVAGRSVLLPTARVERVLRVGAGELRSVGGRQAVAVGQQQLPLASLAGVLGLPPEEAAAGWMACVVVGAGDRRVALAVDEIRGEQEVLGKPVDPAAIQSAVVAGAATLANGALAAILNVPELVRIALRPGGHGPGGGFTAPARPRGLSVLLAEDSITSRTLLKNILELAGHQVEVAVDGAEALARLRAGRYDLVVSDVEMPRLDGIGLTQAIRADAALAHLPVVLVTSLASPADRERGAEAGANAYIVKSSFDQGSLLQAISELA